MKILIVHNRYLIRGGEDECVDSEIALLESHGHQIIKYIQNNDKIKNIPKWKLGIRTIWNQQDYWQIRDLISREKPDVVHVHNFFPLVSPAVYYAANHEQTPVIQSLHNYRLWCLNAYLFRNDQVCEDCLGKIPILGVARKCYRESYVASATIASMLTIHRALGTWQKMVDAYLVLTEFAKAKFIEGGLPASKILIKPNFISEQEVGSGDQDFVLSVGRLSSEKGISTLLNAWQQLGDKIPLKIVGDGDLQPLVEQAAQHNRSIEYLGRKPIEQVYELMGQAKALIFPSLCFEGLPRTIVESFAKGTPVIASNLGSMSSLISHQKTGLHFTPGDTQELANQVDWMLNNPENWQRMRILARQEFEAKYTAKANYRKSMEIYTNLIATKAVR